MGKRGLSDIKGIKNFTGTQFAASQHFYNLDPIFISQSLADKSNF
jgi:hypothetical protein